jgi:anaerobic selenocysteine-containing dehydrogenase
MEEFITACPRNCYSTCTFIVQVENDRVRRILPYKGNLATPEGPCIKGLSYIERAHSANRIKFPLIRKSDGSFVRIATDEAHSIIAEKLRDIREKYGSHSIFWYRGSGNSGLTNEIGSEFWKEYGGVTTTYGNLCWPAGLEAVRLTLGSVKHNVPWDLENAKTIIIWGKNPAETNIQELVFINRAREKGARIIVIDPRRTISADKADLLICPRPGTDGALAMAIAKILVERELTDKDFIEKNVLGFQEFRAKLSLLPADAELITGIPEAAINDLAERIGNGKPLTILPGYGLQRHKNGGQTIRAILALAVLTGNIGKKGSGFNYANLQGYIFDKVLEPLSYYPDPENDKPFRRVISMARLGKDILAASDPGIRAVFVERGNPLLQAPDTQTVRKAFRSLDFRVVVEQFMTDTASEADIILPAKDIFEQTDIVSSYWSPYVQIKPKILDAEGEIMPESEVYYHLSRKMGFNVNTERIPEPGNENIEKWLEKRISGYSQLKLNDLRSGPVLAPGLEEIAYSGYRFDTPSGKIELYSESAKRKWKVSGLPGYTPVNEHDDNEKYPLSFITPNTASRIHSQFGNLEIIKKTIEDPSCLEISPADAGERKIRNGDKLRVFNSRGELFCTARISNRLPGGIAVLPNGIWFSEGGGGNMLVDPDETDMGHGAAFHDTRVQIEKYTGNE